MFGIVDDAPYWNVVMRLYDQDKLVGASDFLAKMGDGYAGSAVPLRRLIESEAKSRREGIQSEIGDHLTLEYIPHEQQDRAEHIGRFVVESVQNLKSRFQWKTDENVLVTLLSIEEDSQWATARYGYCSQKTEYYKICIPFHATNDPHSFYRVFSHEYSHVISLSQSSRRVNHWVGEGFSVYASNDCDDRARDAFISNPHIWLSPERLELQFGPGLDLGSRDKWFAYQQAGWIIRYLAKKHGDHGLMEFLGQYADESILRNLKLLALGESRTRDAVHAEYNTTPQKLFDEVASSLR
jgi:hypothetical protein